MNSLEETSPADTSSEIDSELLASQIVTEQTCVVLGPQLIYSNLLQL